jgi:hypothetical protein
MSANAKIGVYCGRVANRDNRATTRGWTGLAPVNLPKRLVTHPHARTRAAASQKIFRRHEPFREVNPLTVGFGSNDVKFDTYYQALALVKNGKPVQIDSRSSKGELIAFVVQRLPLTPERHIIATCALSDGQWFPKSWVRDFAKLVQSYDLTFRTRLPVNSCTGMFFGWLTDHTKTKKSRKNFEARG